MRDMPFGQMLVGELAGDLLPWVVVLASLFWLWFFAQRSVLVRCNRRVGIGTHALAVLGAMTVIASLFLVALREKAQPPFFRSSPQVSIRYSFPTACPDAGGLFFAKAVAQERTDLIMRPIGGPLPSTIEWRVEARQEWSRVFLCRAGADGSSPAIVAEVASNCFVQAMEVAWPLQKVALVLSRATNNTVVADLQTGEKQTATIAVSPHHRLASRLIDNGSKILFSTQQVLDLATGRVDRSPTEFDQFTHTEPLWNESQKVIVLRASNPSIPKVEWYVFDGHFRLLEKVDHETITRLYDLWRRRQKLDHKYAWVVEVTSPWSRPLVDSAFSYRSDTIRNKEIPPEAAASVW